MMEYEDAPSGAVTLYNYKEPFIPFEGGHGFEGVLLFDEASDSVQCHLCGEWFPNLANHLHREHTTTAAAYKAQVGLAPTTALLGEKQRAVLIAKGTERFKNLKNQKGIVRSKKTRQKISESLKALNRERQNLRGTCPAQLIERLRNKFHELGRTPNADEVGSRETYKKVFGTFKEACELAGVPYVQPGQVHHHKAGRVVESELILWIRENIKDGELPRQFNYAAYAKVSKSAVYSATAKYGGWTDLCRKAMISDSVYRKVRGHRYSKEELLDFLRSFKKINGREAAVSDCKRGLLPHASRYIYYWKSWKEVLKAAYQ